MRRGGGHEPCPESSSGPGVDPMTRASNVLRLIRQVGKVTRYHSDIYSRIYDDAANNVGDRNYAVFSAVVICYGVTIFNSSLYRMLILMSCGYGCNKLVTIFNSSCVAEVRKIILM